jgi:predicted CoA-binding protein
MSKYEDLMKSLSTLELTAIAQGKLKISGWTCTSCNEQGFHIVPNTPTTSSTTFDGCEHCPNFEETKTGMEILKILSRLEEAYKQGGG